MNKPLVLIVEDHPDMRETLVKVFRWEDFDTLTAEDGREALIRLRTTTPDLVILDMEMPGGVNGIDVLRAIRKSSRLSSVPVILHTSEAGAFNLPDAMAADLVLLKPVDPDHLITMARRLIGPAPAENG